MHQETLELDHLQELLWNFASHRVITVASKVGLLHALARGPLLAEEAAAKLGLDPCATKKTVAALAALGLVEAEGGRYRVRPGLAPYFQGDEDDLGPFLMHSHGMYERWGSQLESWVKTGTWDAPPRGRDGMMAFGRAMQAMGRHVARKVASVLSLEHTRTVLDLGGGFGHYARALCRVQPQLTAVVVDLPEVANAAREASGHMDAAERISFVGGDYLAPEVDGQFDLVLLANVLHQESVPRARTMVSSAAKRVAPAGRLVVLDFAIDDERRASVMGTLFAINMRSSGDTYTDPEIREFMRAAGLGRTKRIDLPPHRWLIVGQRADAGDKPGHH